MEGDVSEEVFDSQQGREHSVALQQEKREKLNLSEEVRGAQDVDSEATNTDSEATLSPTSPPSWTGVEPGCDYCGTESRPTDGTAPKPPLNAPSSPMKASIPSATALEPAAAEDDSPKPEEGIVTPPKAPQVELGVKEMTDTKSPEIPLPLTKERSHDTQQSESGEMLLSDLKSTGGLLDGDSEADRAEDQEVSEEECKRLLGSPVSSPAGTETGNQGENTAMMETNSEKSTSETANRNEAEEETSNADVPSSTPTQLQAPCESPTPLQSSSLPPSEMKHEEPHAHELDPKTVESESESKTTEPKLESELEPDLKAAQLLESESGDPLQRSEKAVEEIEAEEMEELPPTKRPKLDDANTVTELKILTEVSKPQSDLPHDVEEQAEEDRERREGVEDEGEPELPAESQNDVFSEPSEMMEVAPSENTPGSKNESDVSHTDEFQTSSSSPHGDSALQTSGKDSKTPDASVVGSDHDTNVTPPADACDELSHQKLPLASSVEKPPSSSEEEKATLIHGERLPSWSQFADAAVTDKTGVKNEQENITEVSPEPSSPGGKGSCDTGPGGKGSCDTGLKDVPITSENPAGGSTNTVKDPVFPKGDDRKGDDRKGDDRKGDDDAERHSPKHQSQEGSNITEQSDEHVNSSTSNSTIDEPQHESAPIAPQNRLSVDKPGFDRYQHRRRLSAQSLKHGKETGLDKKESKLRPKSQPWLPKGLFEADPISVKGSKKERSLEHERSGKEREKQEHFDERHGFRKARVPPGKPYRGGDPKVPAEKSKLAPHSRSYAPTNTSSHRHQRGSDTIPVQETPRARSREPSKPHSRPSSRQGHRTSPTPPGHFHSPTWSNQREVSPSSSIDDPLVVRPRSHHDPIKRWSPDDLDHRYTHSRRATEKRSHRSFDPHLTGSKKQRTSGFEISRKEQRGSRETSPEMRKYYSTTLDQEGWKLPEQDISSAERRRHREEEESNSRGRGGDIRRKSYESISDDDLVLNPADQDPTSNREDPISDRKSSSYTSVSKQHRSPWDSRKARKRRLSDGEELDEDDYGREGGTKHQKHEHKKWQKLGRKEGGKEHKQKRNTDEKHRHGYFKH